MKSARRCEGLTLLELVIAVFIISAAVGVSIPALTRGRSSLSLRAAGRDLVSVMRYAREKAVTNLEEVHLVLDRESHTVSFWSEGGEGKRNLALPRQVRFESFARSGEPIVEGPLIIRFLPNGSAEAAEVLLRADNGAALGVATDPITGGARVVRSDGVRKP